MEESQDPYQYDLNQTVWTKDPQSGEGGAVGTMVQQGGEIPEIVEHDSDGNIVKKTKQQKRAAKKARREAYKQSKIQEARESKVTDPDAVKEEGWEG